METGANSFSLGKFSSLKDIITQNFQPAEILSSVPLTRALLWSNMQYRSLTWPKLTLTLTSPIKGEEINEQT